MSDNIEQITKEPENKIEKTKDPKKVLAGKKLAQYHKKAKQALQNVKDESDQEESVSWVPEISLPVVLTMVGITLTGIDLYFRYQKTSTPPTIKYVEKESNQVKPITKTSTVRMGME